MKRRDFLRNVAAAGAVGAASALAPLPAFPEWEPNARPPGSRRLDDGWRFHLGDAPGAEAPAFDDGAWEQVRLPHAARIEALVTGAPGSPTAQWQGLCWYRLPLRVGAGAADRKVLLEFEAAMNDADVWVDGQLVGRHRGGFVPFVLDISERVPPGGVIMLAVRLDNRDDPVTGPKPLRLLDFNMYHGLYRYVHLIVKDPLHLTHPLLADRPASGGVFVTYPSVSARSATVRVQAHVRNDHASPRTFRVRNTLATTAGARVAEIVSPPVTLRAGEARDVVQELVVAAPALWSPRSPTLHVLRTEVLVDGAVVDADVTRIGIRRIAIDREGFRINGERMFLRGTNRHQEHPYVGFAVPAGAQYRDAKRIKDAGFDYIRLSHYPHAPAFMDACDELGLVVMDCIPGWQYFNPDPAFAELQYRNCRDLVRRDRNRPSVIMWEVSLNETDMPAAFIARAHAIAHEEYPGDQCFTAGWMHGYDVYLRARQHGGCPADGDHPCVVSEYGDWEYYAMTAGLDQEGFAALTPGESNSRQLRWQGERAMLQQAANFQEAHNDNRGGAAFADGLWVMYDYDRGYSPDVESSGCADIFRLPKYSWYFFRSQRSPADGPMAFIASEWLPSSARSVRVFSNCDEVELRLNGRTIARQAPDRDRRSTHLEHPPFTFALPVFEPGTLEAIGYVGSTAAAMHIVRTAGDVARLRLAADLRGRALASGEQDLVFCHAALTDARDTVVSDAFENVAYGVTGDARLVGANPLATDAGLSSCVVQTGLPRAADAAQAVPPASIAVYALAIIRSPAGAHLLGDALGLRGQPSPFELRYTTDCSAPSARSRRASGPIMDAGSVRAALLVGGRMVATLDERAPKRRMQPSVPATTRDPFRHG